MSLSRTEIANGLIDELTVFEALVRSLDATDLAQPSRCAGWSVGDVAAHLIGSMVDVTEGRLDGLGTPEVTAREVDERRGCSPAQLADELAGAIKGSVDLLAVFDDAAWDAAAPGGYDGTLGDGVEALWYDAYVHADDIRAALGRPEVRTDSALRGCISHLSKAIAHAGWEPATLELDGVPAFAVGSGAGRTITGDPLAFTRAVTGRADPTAFGYPADANIYA